MRRWPALALALTLSGCTNAPLAQFLDLVHPIHVGGDGRAADPLTADPNSPTIPPPNPVPSDTPSQPNGRLLPPSPLSPGSPPNPGPSGSNFSPPSSNGDAGVGPFSIPNR
jgi:hypothetical protein